MKLIVKRKAKENNFKAPLQAIQDQMISPTKLPDYLREAILGYGDYE